MRQRVFGKPVTFAAFVDLDLGETAFIVDPIVPAGGIVLCHGKRGHGKTQFATTLAISVANGDVFAGKYGTHKSPILLLQADNPVKSQQMRLKRALSDVKEKENVIISAFEAPIDIRKVPTAAEWVQEVRRIAPKIVIIDSLRKVHTENENDAATPSLVYGAFRELFGPEPTLFFLHHDRKSYVGPKGDGDPNEEFRGSGAWLDDCDTGIHIVQGKASNAPSHKKITAYFSKLRDCEEQDPIVFSMDQTTLLLKPAGAAGGKDKAIQFLHEYPETTKNGLVKYLMEELKMSRGYAYKVAEELLGKE